ncbi:hypothetical protein F4553_003467 [Allocatelliglobosispora scoriae]|uniref:Uncharacterized protein n=1 Tax=Allocatelliglobosispora scoriae TaxID=643052 RepID=A0A841BRQ9_9ACTN|nr:hypothetical protein [Allocatelliglobosispora scoriae]MBB5870088.1 hypothetical protein [Allocatelliglobosispora scoriae]
MRRPLLRIAPLTLLAAGLLLAPAAGVIASDIDSVVSYRAPSRFTPGWGPADIPREVVYLDGGAEVHSGPPSADAHPAIDALAAVRVVDANSSGHSYEQHAEVALRIVWFTKEYLSGTPTAYRIQPDEKRLMYVVLIHDHIAGGGGRYRPGQAPQAPRQPGGIITFVDALTGELVYSGGQVVGVKKGTYPGQ